MLLPEVQEDDQEGGNSDNADRKSNCQPKD